MEPSEDADIPGARHELADPPKIVMGALLFGRNFEICGLDSGRIDVPEHAANGAVLAARIQPLEDEQQSLFGIGVEQLLHFANFLAIILGLLLRLLLLEAATISRIEIRQGDFSFDNYG